MHLELLKKISDGRKDFTQNELKRLSAYAENLIHDKDLLALVIPYLSEEDRAEKLKETLLAACADGNAETAKYLILAIEQVEGIDLLVKIAKQGKFQLVKDSISGIDLPRSFRD